MPKMNANAFSQKDYDNFTALRPQKNKPKQSQWIKRARSIFRRFILAYLAHAPHINLTTSIFNPNARIRPLKSEKKPENPQVCMIFVLIFIDASCLFYRIAESFSITFFSCTFLNSVNFSRRLLSANAKNAGRHL